MKNLHARLKRLESAVPPAAAERVRQVRRARLAGASDEEILDALNAAVPEGCDDVMQRLIAQMEEYHSRPPRLLYGDVYTRDQHGLCHLIAGVREGWFCVPEVLPRAWWESWVNGFEHHPAHSTPVPSWKCGDCEAGLPNTTPDGLGHYPTRCPVCGSGNLLVRSNYGGGPPNWREPGWRGSSA